MNKQIQENLLDLVKESYEEIAEDFSTTRQKYLWPEIVKLAGMVRDGDRVLDVGCGNGRLVRAFSGKQINYIGIDNSQKLVEMARQKSEILNPKFETNSKSQIKNSKQTQNFKFIFGNVLELDKLPEKDFDYVFCIAVLHHLPGEDLRIKALGQMKDKLKPGGKIIITVWNLWSQKKFKKLIMKNVWLKIIGQNKMDWGDIIFPWRDGRGRIKAERYYHAFTIYELRKIIKKTGLKIEKLYKDKYNYYAVLTR